jgi:hypothetical protein
VWGDKEHSFERDSTSWDIESWQLMLLCLRAAALLESKNRRVDSTVFCMHACFWLRAHRLRETMGSIFLDCICCTSRREHRGSMNLFCLVVYAAWDCREDPAVLLGIWKQRKHRERRFLGSLYNRRMLPRAATDFGRSYKESSSEVSCHVERTRTPRQLRRWVPSWAKSDRSIADGMAFNIR